MTKKIFGFNTQLKVGDKGEKMFFDYYSKIEKIEKADGRIFDFKINSKTIELKADSYPMDKTENFFMERYGNIDTKTIGGPWRTLKDDIDFFVYLFINDGTFFWFNPSELCALLDKNIKNFKEKQIWNKGWTAIGYAVPRSLCENICIRKDTI